MKTTKLLLYIHIALGFVPYFFVLSVEASTATLSLHDYLEAVQERNDDYRSAREAEHAAQLYSSEGQLLFSPTLFVNGEYKDDAKPSFIPTFNYDKLLTQTYLTGVSQQTNFGLQGKLYYSFVQTTYKGLLSTYNEGRPTLELSQSLWRNDFGQEIRAQVQALTAQSQAKRFMEKFHRTNILVQAEMSYWRLALARQSYEIGQNNVLRGQKLLAWAQRRSALSLSDRSDLLQAHAALQARQLDLKLYKDELRAASLAFNGARGLISDEVQETLEPLSQDLVKKWKGFERVVDRADVQSAREQSEAQKAWATVNRERNQPNLEVFASYAFNSRENSREEAFSESWSGDRPTKVVGIRFSSPLNFKEMSRVQEGYGREAKAAEFSYQRRRFLQDQDWRDLNLRMSEAKTRLVEAEELERLQKEKLDYEKQRQDHGRTTLFQVLTFEGDYLSAQALRLKTLAEVLQIMAQMKLYGVEYESR